MGDGSSLTSESGGGVRGSGGSSSSIGGGRNNPFVVLAMVVIDGLWWWGAVGVGVDCSSSYGSSGSPTANRDQGRRRRVTSSGAVHNSLAWFGIAAVCL